MPRRFRSGRSRRGRYRKRLPLPLMTAFDYGQKRYRAIGDRSLAGTYPSFKSLGPVLAARGMGIPPRIMLKLRYCDTFKFGVTGPTDQATWLVNSLFDTQVTAETGYRNAQPAYFDQLITLWDVYLVHGVKYRVTFINNASGAPKDVAITFDTDATPVPQTADEACEQYKARGGIVESSNPVTFKGYVDPFKHIGIYKQGQWGAGMFGTATTNPANPLYMHVFASEPGLASVTHNMHIKVELVFYAEFKKRGVIVDA